MSKNEAVSRPQTQEGIERYRAGEEFGYNKGIKACLSEISKLREVIKFYADEKNWDKSKGISLDAHQAALAEVDRGTKARTSLWSPDFEKEKSS